MPADHYKIINTYRGIGIADVNYDNKPSQYYSVVVNNQLSILALISVQACKNVIDTHLKYKEK